MKKYQKARFVTKANGRKEPFSKIKLTRSLSRTGLPMKTCQDIADKVAGEIQDGDKTGQIYKKAFNLLKEKSSLATVRYSLKKALFELGPEGHFFEDYVARYFERKGYATKVCQTLQGKYVRHEVDCISSLKNDQYFSECKFHNRSGTKNDVKITLYVKARWDDLRTGPEGKNLKGYFVFSNTAFTSDAILYAKGTGLGLMGVNSPPDKSFLEEIRELKLYPVTSLRNLTKAQKHLLLQKKIIIADEIKPDMLFKLGFEEAQTNRILDEIQLLKRSQL